MKNWWRLSEQLPEKSGRYMVRDEVGIWTLAYFWAGGESTVKGYMPPEWRTWETGYRIDEKDIDIWTTEDAYEQYMFFSEIKAL